MLLLLLLEHLQLLLNGHFELELLLLMLQTADSVGVVVCPAGLCSWVVLVVIGCTANEGIVVARCAPVVVQRVAEEDRRVRQVVRNGRHQLLRLIPADTARATISH